MEFSYDGGAVGRGGDVTLLVDDEKVADGRVDATIPYYFAFDETFDVGCDRGSPVVDDYPPVRNRFSGRISQVRIDLGPQEQLPREAAEHTALKQMD
jgi:arylsulfatase